MVRFLSAIGDKSCSRWAWAAHNAFHHVRHSKLHADDSNAARIAPPYLPWQHDRQGGI